MPLTPVYSTLSTDTLAALLREEYGAATSVQLLRRGINDTYLARNLPDHERAILRVYRHGWRTPEEVAWELDFIAHLAEQGVPVSRPIPGVDGQLSGVLDAPEGPRSYAVFEYLPGRGVNNVPEDAASYGELVARLHTAADDFTRPGRFELNLDHLIWQPMEYLRPLLADWPEQGEALEGFARRTHARLSDLAPDLSWGACHGDLHEVNARINDTGQVSVFDFDCGGPGFRAYDLAVYWWSLVTHAGESPDKMQPVWDAYLNTYLAGHPLTDADRVALPHFVTARSLWFMGLMASRITEFGTETLGQPFFDFGVNFMRDWEKRHAAP